MAGIMDKWVHRLRPRDRQDKPEPESETEPEPESETEPESESESESEIEPEPETDLETDSEPEPEPQSIICDICGAKIKSREAWLEHAKSDADHSERWPTLESAQLYVNKGSNRPNSQDSNSRKRRADTNDGNTGDRATSGDAVEEDQNADAHRAKRWSPSPTQSKEISGQQSEEFRDGIPRRAQHQSSVLQQPQIAHRPPQPTTTQQPPRPPSNDDESTSKMMRQPETRPISQDKLVAEVKGIYAGLVMVETKCIEVDNAQSSNTDANSKLNNEQWHALIALHRTLLHEHHDFFLASQHPSASAALRRLASKFAMPARMWRHGIHSFLELLRHRLPASLEHMLTFLYLAYSMMTLLYETVPAFEDTWIECLGDLGRYRMAIEDDDIRDREIWIGVSRHWYSKASDKSPTTGRLYHHLAILARPNALQQLYYYTKSLCVPIPFSSARENIMTLFDPVLSNSTTRLAPIDAAFVRAHGILFSGKFRDQLGEATKSFIDQLDSYIARSPKRWLESGYYIGISLACSLLGYGAESNVLMRAISRKPDETDVPMDGSTISEATPDEMFKLALDFAESTITRVVRRWGDTNTLPFLHTILVFMNHMTQYPAAISHLENQFPWKLTALMLNTLLLSCESGYEVQSHFRLPEKDQLPRPLPEDFAMRGLLYSEDYFPNDWFRNDKIDEDEKYFELPSVSEERKDRILSLGCKIATSGNWLLWDEKALKFSVPQKYDVKLDDVPT